jgi:hypothetical protein
VRDADFPRADHLCSRDFIVAAAFARHDLKIFGSWNISICERDMKTTELHLGKRKVSCQTVS